MDISPLRTVGSLTAEDLGKTFDVDDDIITIIGVKHVVDPQTGDCFTFLTDEAAPMFPTSWDSETKCREGDPS